MERTTGSVEKGKQRALAVAVAASDASGSGSVGGKRQRVDGIGSSGSATVVSVIVAAVPANSGGGGSGVDVQGGERVDGGQKRRRRAKSARDAHGHGRRYEHGARNNNARMHGRVAYKHENRARPDFALLAELYPWFAAHVVPRRRGGGVTLDFTDAAAVRALTRVLLWHYHQLYIEMPPGRLCPTVTSRVNYVHWLNDLLQLRAGVAAGADIAVPTAETATAASAASRAGGAAPVYGIDVGVGASCIYPLLGCRLYGWAFLGVDVDRTSLAWARRNVVANGMQAYIALRHANGALVEDGDGEVGGGAGGSDNVGGAGGNDDVGGAGGNDGDCWLFAHLIAPELIAEADAAEGGGDGGGGGGGGGGDGVAGGDGGARELYQFCMCNPPFFETPATQVPNPATVCTGTRAEMVTAGGEVQFVARMVRDSLVLRARVRWYTSMLGRKRSLKPLRALLRAYGITNVRTTTFYQGRTTRWALAWSFGEHGVVAPTPDVATAPIVVGGGGGGALEFVVPESSRAASELLAALQRAAQRDGLVPCTLDAGAQCVAVVLSGERLRALCGEPAAAAAAAAAESTVVVGDTVPFECKLQLLAVPAGNDTLVRVAAKYPAGGGGDADMRSLVRRWTLRLADEVCARH